MSDIIDVDVKDVTEETDSLAQREERVYELIKPIREQILKCETRGEVLMMAGQLLQHAKDMYICELGIDTTKLIFKNLEFEMPVDENEIDQN